jgi:hypothetical protein
MVKQLPSGIWHDVTGDINTETWVLNASAVQIVITKALYHPKNGWSLYCDKLGLDVVCSQFLTSEDIEEAKVEALEVIREKINTFTLELKAALVHIEPFLEAAKGVKVSS